MPIIRGKQVDPSSETQSGVIEIATQTETDTGTDDARAVTPLKLASTTVAGIDSTAIHDNVASEISAVTAKATPVSGDFILIEDSAAANVKKSITMGGIDHDALTNFVANEHIDWTAASAGTIHTDNYIEGGAGTDTTAIHDNVSGEISVVTEKTTPVSADLLLIEDSAASNAKKRVQVGNLPSPTLSKSITVESPTATEDISIFFTNLAATITEIRAVVRGSTPSVTWTVRHGTDRSAAGSEAVTGGTTTTSQTTGSDVTSFNDATIVADSFVWLETTAQTGTVNELAITIIYTED
jgi:hypothetical protein